MSTLAELAQLTGLPSEQLARLLGVSRRSVDNWLGGNSAPGSETIGRVTRLLDAITPLGATPAERRAELFRSSGGASLFHRLLREAPRQASAQFNSISVRRRLGV